MNYPGFCLSENIFIFPELKCDVSALLGLHFHAGKCFLSAHGEHFPIVSVEKLCESYFCSFADTAFSYGSLKISFLFDFQQLHTDILRNGRDHTILSRWVG